MPRSHGSHGPHGRNGSHGHDRRDGRDRCDRCSRGPQLSICQKVKADIKGKSKKVPKNGVVQIGVRLINRSGGGH